jgi:hypothetical protein
MESNVVQIECTSYFSREYASIDQIMDVMEKIEHAEILRGEFILIFPKDRNIPTLCAAVLFRKGGHGAVEGWFVWHSIKGSPTNIVYCLPTAERRRGDFIDVMRNGAPEAIHKSAIHTKDFASRLMNSVAKGEAIAGLEECSYGDVIRYDETM